MAGAKPHFLTTAIVLLGLLAALDFTGAQIGACYGRNGNELPNPPDVVALGSDIELILDVPNDQLQGLADNPDTANNWVQSNVRNYGNVKFKYISVGNEVSPIRSDTSQYVSFVLPAMRNIQNAISAAGLANQIKVSTAVESGLTTNGNPPSNGVFRGDVSNYITPIIQFLQSNGSPLLANIYPYFAYKFDPVNIPLAYALGQNGADTPDGRYPNLFSALHDVMQSAIEKAGGPSVNIVVSESGWPTAGGTATSTENARIYNQNLINQVLGTSGTPKRPGRSIETYIFAIFDENQKSGEEYEKHFGLFSPNGQIKYPISFTN